MFRQQQPSSPKSESKHLRDPPPALFLGPPSQNASHVSLLGANTPIGPPDLSTLTSSHPSMLRQRSRSNIDVDAAGGPSLPRPSLPRPRQESEGKKQADRTDALWAEMQSTLEEVKLTAVNGTHVFGQEHAKALDQLREAQIGLAQAWARSEADEVVDSIDEESKGLNDARGLPSGSEGRSVRDTMGSTATGAGGPESSGLNAENIESKLNDTEADILLARRRREANDRYFQRVNGGVLDVVAKLEQVAAAMRAVEQESRDIWGETENVISPLSVVNAAWYRQARNASKPPNILIANEQRNLKYASANQQALPTLSQRPIDIDIDINDTDSLPLLDPAIRKSVVHPNLPNIRAMEPRARVGKNRGQQNFSDQELQHFLFAYGDVHQSLDTTRKVFDELLTDFITELCFEAARSAQLAGRQKIKLDDIKFACRKNPIYLGKIEEVMSKKEEIDKAKKLVDVNDDKITKSGVKALEEPLGDADDDADADARTVGGKSSGTGAGK
ncbi:uncharacterized protein BP5553_05542 [Venustampulla echinocandica]|uniref:Transcription initiation factor TFIID subunit 13 n=1 Tax=Venustampulla echinocandica TaxID=2656787 RepID=A0A370TRF8_9HELO|nr:uncharacterized protein BP5553_05542 [Venustampulla echinocandica]RDL38109.1 hypothetical protein BP5553_05542 [Venustampulla echinocandica]